MGRNSSHFDSLILAIRIGFPTMVNATSTTNSKYKAVIAGGLAGVMEICCTYPTEFVKTSMQLSSKNLSSMTVIKDTIRNNGFLGLYRGLSSMVYFAAPKAAIRFGSFEAANGILTGPNGSDKFNLGAAKGFLSGLIAGTFEAIFVTTPQETIKIKLINDMFRSDNQPPKFKNFFHGVRTIIAEDSIGAVYKGLVPTILKVSTAQATRFGVFQVIPKEWKEGPIKTAAAGAFAGAVSVILFQGIDVVKSRMQGLNANKYTSSLDCLRRIINDEGILGLYKGVGPRLTRVCLEVGITMTLYGEIMKVLERM